MADEGDVGGEVVLLVEDGDVSGEFNAGRAGSDDNDAWLFGFFLVCEGLVDVFCVFG